MGVQHPPVAEQDVEGSACSIREAPVAKRRRTTAQVETGTVYSVWLQRSVFSLLLKKQSEGLSCVCTRFYVKLLVRQQLHRKQPAQPSPDLHHAEAARESLQETRLWC